MGKFFDYKVNTGSYNMAFDENILNESIKNNESEPILRFYGWNPACVSLGRNQKDIIDYSICKKFGLDVVRRATGGRALLHDKELTYSFVCPVDFLNVKDSVILSYKEISEALILGMKKIGIEINFPEDKKVKTSPQYCMSLATGADLSYKDKKLIGSAQVRKSGYILQHGSILIDLNLDLIQNLFNEKINIDEITSLKEINSNIKIEDLVYAVKKGFEHKFNQFFL